MNEWKYIDTYVSLPSTDFICCDTRDFHILCISNKERVHGVCESIRHSKEHNNLSKCKFTLGEILKVLKDLETKSGGKGEWRFISTKSHPNWLKYIRFIKTNETVNEEPVYIAYNTSRINFELLSRELLEEPINKERLNFIKQLIN